MADKYSGKQREVISDQQMKQEQAIDDAENGSDSYTSPSDFDRPVGKEELTDKQNQTKGMKTTESDKKSTPTSYTQVINPKLKVQNAQETKKLDIKIAVASNDTLNHKNKSDVISSQTIKNAQLKFSENGSDLDRSQDLDRTTGPVNNTEENNNDSTDKGSDFDKIIEPTKYTEENTQDLTIEKGSDFDTIIEPADYTEKNMDSTDAFFTTTIDELNKRIKDLDDNLLEERRHNRKLNEELKRFRDEKNKTEKEIKELQVKEIRMSRENEELKTELKTVKTEITQLKSNKDCQLKESDELKRANSGLQRDQKELQENYNKLKETLDEVQKKNQEINDELCSKQGSNADFRKQLEYLKETKEKLEKDVEERRETESTLQRESDGLKKQLKDFKTKLAKEKELASKQSIQINTLTGEKRDLEEEIKRLKEKGQTAILDAKLLEDNETLNMKLVQEQFNNETMKKHLKQLQEKLKTSGLVNEEKTKQIQSLTSTNTKLNEDYKKVKEEKENFQSWYHELKTKLKSAECKVSDLENEKRVSESQNVKIKRDLKGKEDECLLLKKENGKLIEKNENHQKEIERLNKQITDISSDIESLKEQRQSFQTWFHDAKKSKQAAKAELEKTNNSLMDLQRRCQTLQTTVSEKENHIAQLTQSFANKEKDYNERQIQYDAFIQDLQLKWQHQEEECKQCKDELNKLKQENDVLCGVNTMHTQQLQQMRDEWNNFIGLHENMKQQKEDFQKLYQDSDQALRENSQQLKEAEAKFQKLNSRIAELEYTLSVKEGRITDLQNEAKQMEENYKAEIQKLKELIDQYMVEIKTLEQALIPISDLKENNNELEYHLEYTKNELEQTRKSHIAVTDRVTHLLTELKKKRVECIQYQKEKDKIKRCNELLTGQVKSLQDEKDLLVEGLMQAERRSLGFTNDDYTE